LLVPDIEAVVAGVQHPTAALASVALKLLADLGVKTNNPAFADAQKITQYVAKVENHEFAPVTGQVMEFGVEGIYGFMPLDSTPGVLLGLSDTPWVKPSA
jgi:hypothetical protein